MDEFKALIGKVATGAGLSRDEAASAFNRMMSGEATPSQMGGLLMALRVRGESVEEITGAVTAMRAKMLKVKAPANAIDVVDDRLKRDAGRFRRALAPRPARHEHPRVERRADDAAAFDQGLDLIVGQLSLMRHDRPAIGMARPDRPAI